MIHLAGTLTCATADDIALLQRLLATHVAASRAELGCISFNATQTANPLVWQLDKTFSDQAALDAHQSRTRASAWFDATRHLARNFYIT